MQIIITQTNTTRIFIAAKTKNLVQLIYILDLCDVTSTLTYQHIV